MSDRANLVRVLTTTTGTGTMALGTAYSVLFMTSSESGMVDGRTYTYLVTEGNDWELGKGVYTASGTTLSRVTVMASRIGGTLGTTKMTLTGTAQVRIVESADDMGALRGTRAVTGTSDTLAQSDLGRAVTYSNAASIAVSLAQAGASSSFLDGWSVHVKNTGAGTVTITPTTSTINDGATLVLAQNLGAFIWSDGTNYHAYIIPLTKPLLAANNLSDVSAKYTAFDNLSVKGADIASAATLNLDTATGNLVDVTGTTTITAITLSEGRERTVRFTGALTLTNGASLLLPGGVNITTVAGDFAIFRGYAAGVVRCVMSGAGDVTAAAVIADNRLVRGDGGAKGIQESVITVADTTGALSRTGGIAIEGTNTNDSAAAGYVGEYVSSSVDYASRVSLTTTTAKTITSISLTAGDWDLSIIVFFVPAAGTTINTLIACYNTTTNTLTTSVAQHAKISYNGLVTNAESTVGRAQMRVSLSATATHYLVAYADFGTSTLTAYGMIEARRVR